LLKVDDLHVSYGKIRAVNGVSMEVKRGEIVSLVGANGAGKSTLVNSIMGLIEIQRGRIELAGKDITHSPPWIRARMGMVLVPESGRIFTSMSVMENLELGAYLINDRVKFKQRLDFVLSLFPRLAERRKQIASTLSGGEKQMLAIGRALMMDPKILLLDEVSLGLMPKLVDEIFEVIFNLKKTGLTILLAEQNTKKALEISDRTYVLQNGKVVKHGESSLLMADPEIKRAYLGV